MKIKDAYPKRIICLTEECTETLYLLKESNRIIGISNYAVRPKEARKEKKVVCSFINANIDKISKPFLSQKLEWPLNKIFFLGCFTYIFSTTYPYFSMTSLLPHTVAQPTIIAQEFEPASSLCN